MANKQTGKAIVVLVALFAVFAVAMFGLNFVTGPMIAVLFITVWQIFMEECEENCPEKSLSPIKR